MAVTESLQSTSYLRVSTARLTSCWTHLPVSKEMQTQRTTSASHSPSSVRCRPTRSAIQRGRWRSICASPSASSTSGRGGLAAMSSASFPLFLLYYDIVLPGEPLGVSKIVHAVALATPFSIVSLLACRDLIFGAVTTSRWEAAGYITFGCCLCLAFGALSGLLLPLLGIMVFCLFHVAAAVAQELCCGDGGNGGTRGHGRAAILYQRYLGIAGEWFVEKTAAMQFATIVLQATSKLQYLGAAVAMKGAVGPRVAWLAPLVTPLYWLFVSALVVNATVPFALLQSKRRVLQRDAVAALDIALDLVYFFDFMCSMVLAEAFPTALTIAPYDYLSMFWPLLHIVTVARSIEAAAVWRRAEDEENALSASEGDADGGGGAPQLRRLSWRAAAACSALALSVIALTLFSGDRDRYPFGGAWNGMCRPCECDGNNVLVSCALPADLKATALFLDNKRIAGIRPGAFQGLKWLKTLSLSENDIAMLRAGAFDGLPHLDWGLELSFNSISMIESGAFRGLRTTSTLALRDNPLEVLPAGVLGGGLDELHNLFLDDCGLLREVEAGAFPSALKHVWLPGAALNCSQIAAQLPGGAICLDGAHCDVETIQWVGRGICDELWGHNTAECAWDGGDCETAHETERFFRARPG